MVQVTLKEAQKSLPDLINAVSKGEKVLIQKDESFWVELVPIKERRKKPQFGSAKGFIEMEDDFDDALEDFNEYLQ